METEGGILLSKEVSAALGTERQFAKQPELPYALNLIVPQMSNGIHQGVNLDAQRLSQSLGVLSTRIQAEVVAKDKRERDQATLVNADKMLLGKTKEDLQQFDRMSALQHQSDKFDLSDNPYAMAVLEKGIGKMASTYAKEQWADLPEAQRPKSVQEAVQQYGKLLEQNRKDFGDNITNVTAFEQGYYEGAMSDTMKVANEAHARINDDLRYKGRQTAMTSILDDVYRGATGLDFETNLAMNSRQLELYSKTPQEYVKAMSSVAEVLASKDLDGSRLKSLEGLTFFDGTKLKDMMSFAPLKAKIADNANQEIARQSFEKFKTANGGFNWQGYLKEASKRPFEMFNGGIPEVNIPISAGDNPDLASLSSSMKGAINKVGGLLFNMGYGDVMQLTSGYRTPEHNASVGGVEGSKHTTGEALDIYLGDNLSKEQQAALKGAFSSSFGEVLFHDAGSGYHLHLADYNGGLDKQGENKEDISYAAYSTDRNNKVNKLVRALANDHKRQYQEQRQTQIQDTTLSVLTAGSQEEAINAIKNSGLSPIDQQKMMKQVEKRFNTSAKQDYESMSFEQQMWYDYEKGRGGHSLKKDWWTMKRYNEALQSDEDMPDKLQEQADEAASRMNAYWVQATGGAYNPDNEGASSADKPDPNKARPTPAQANANIQACKDWVASNPKDKNGNPLSRQQIEARLFAIAPQYGLDGNTLINEIYKNDGGGVD